MGELGCLVLGRLLGLCSAWFPGQSQSGNNSQYLSLLWHLGHKWQKCLAVPWGCQGCPSGSVQSGLSRDLWAWCQHLTKRKPPLFPALVLTSLTALYREASVCPGTGTNAAHGRPATLLVLFLLSLLRQGCIKRVFAVLKPRITPHLLKVFRTATLLAPAPLLELVQSDPVPAVPVPAAAPAQTEPLFALLGVCRGGCSPSRARTS